MSSEARYEVEAPVASWQCEDRLLGGGERRLVAAMPGPEGPEAVSIGPVSFDVGFFASVVALPLGIGPRALRSGVLARK